LAILQERVGLLYRVEPRSFPASGRRWSVRDCGSSVRRGESSLRGGCVARYHGILHARFERLEIISPELCGAYQPVTDR